MTREELLASLRADAEHSRRIRERGVKLNMSRKEAIRFIVELAAHAENTARVATFAVEEHMARGEEGTPAAGTETLV